MVNARLEFPPISRFMSTLPEKNRLRGRSAGSLPEQRLVTEPRLMRSSPDRAVRVRALVGGRGGGEGRTCCCVLEQDTLSSQCFSPTRCINGY